MAASPQYHVDIDYVRKHYDRLSSLYQLFWGEHLHHGYWDNQQSAAQAQVRLMERLAEIAKVPRDAEVLDIGCGVGGSALWLAENFGCRVTGLTISPVQARMATKKSRARGLSDRVRFQVTDANEWQPEPESVDLIWIMESSEHFRDKKGFFKRCATMLKPGGILAVAAWLRRDGPVREDENELVATIGAAMMSASLDGLSAYRRWMEEAGTGGHDRRRYYPLYRTNLDALRAHGGTPTDKMACTLHLRRHAILRELVPSYAPGLRAGRDGFWTLCRQKNTGLTSNPLYGLSWRDPCSQAAQNHRNFTNLRERSAGTHRGCPYARLTSLIGPIPRGPGRRERNPMKG